MRYFFSTRRLGAALIIAASGFSAPALAGASDWVKGAKSSARLVSAGGLGDGFYRAGVEIALAPQTITYWRNPGDAGSPPAFDFSASDNLAAVEPIYPAPKRIPEAGAEAFGYDSDVILPLRLRPADPARPVRLRLKLDYAACEKICIPEQASFELTLAPGDARTPEAAGIAAFEARAPRAWDGPAPAPTRAAGAAKPTWRLGPPFAPEAGGDLFAEGPDGSFIDAKRRGDGAFDLVLEQPPLDGATAFDLRLTRTTAQGAHEATLRLDARAGTP